MRARRETREIGTRSRTHLLRTPTPLPIVLTWCGRTAEQAADDHVTGDTNAVTCQDCWRYMRRDRDMLERWASA